MAEEPDIDVSFLETTCHFCPTQVEGDHPEGTRVYARYRFGALAIDIDGTTIFNEQVGDDYDGVMDDTLLKQIAATAHRLHANGEPPTHPDLRSLLAQVGS